MNKFPELLIIIFDNYFQNKRGTKSNNNKYNRKSNNTKAKSD